MRIAKESSNHEHCWHAHRGPIWMVIPPGMTLQECCECHATRMIHIDHVGHHGRVPDLDQWLRNDTPYRRIY